MNVFKGAHWHFEHRKNITCDSCNQEYQGLIIKLNVHKKNTSWEHTFNLCALCNNFLLSGQAELVDDVVEKIGYNEYHHVEDNGVKKEF